jgi:hypothetical protein
MRYEPLFNSRVPGATYSSISVDGRVFRLGERHFRPRYERFNENPGFIFESGNITVRQIFTPIKTSSSQVINGIMITFIIENTGTQDSLVGLRMLIDTELGEGRDRVPFITSSQIISNETLIEGDSGIKFWISRGQRVSLMGSIINPLDVNAKVPDFVHFANWKRLHDSPWRLRYSQRRSFNNDSAVCYIYEPAILESGSSFTYTIFLTTEDIAFYNGQLQERQQERPPETTTVIAPQTGERPTINITAIEQEARIEAAQNNQNADTITLVRLFELLNQFIEGDIELNEQDLIEIEKAIERRR